ncbi:MAG: cadherin domain-containing protein [Trichodesmium sp. St18_bin1]|nr:cadherin domain-containing protein [Trichodesmium sp. St18_bin1]
MKIYLSKDSRIDVFDREIGSYDLGYLAHNAAKVKTVSVTLPPHNDPIWSSDNQKYTIGMIIDPDNNIDEYSWRRGYDHTKHRGSWHGDNNNSNIGIGKDSQPITIKIPSLIDLSLQSFYTDLETTSGNDISVNFQIKNSGNKDLTNIPIDFYLSENSIISNSRDKYLGSYNLSSLSKDSTTGTLKKKLNLPSSSDTFWSGSGKYYIGAIVDPNNNISETDESNNSTHRNIDIDLVPNISIENTTGPVIEGDEGTTNAIFTVDLGVPSEETIEISYKTGSIWDYIRFAGGSPSLDYYLTNATPEYDYKPIEGSLTFNPGETTKKIVVPIIGDEKVESDLSFTVYLVDPTSPYKKLVETEGIIKNDDTGFSKQSFDIAENSENQTIIGSLHVNETIIRYDDFTSSGGIHHIKIPELKFNITDNVDPDNDGNSAFSLDGDRLIVNDSDDLDYETNPILNISIEASNGELTDEATVTINLTDVDDNQIPTDLKLDNKTINENEPDNSLVGNFSTTDLDSGDNFTYELVIGNGDTDNKAFTINNDQLKINNSPNYENQSSYSILVQTTDKSGASYQKQLTIKVKNINEAPEIINQSFDIAENSENQNLIGTINATDPENDTLKFSIINNIDTNKDGNSAFILDGDRLLVNDSKDLDYETNHILNFNVEVSDEELKDEATITVNLSDIQELEMIENEGTASLAKNKNDSTYWIVNGDNELQLKNRQGQNYSDNTTQNWDSVVAELGSADSYSLCNPKQNDRIGQ